jgi:tRNA threonylcarbamoyladenosine biosynthesis protein TsaE
MELTYTQKDISKIADNILTVSASKVFLFYGGMGVGKTTLIKEMAKHLGVIEISQSPSFSIVNEYEATGDTIFHFDFYRIENLEEAYDIGVEDYLYSGHYVFIEWPEKINGLLPENGTKIYIEKNLNGSRTLTMMPMK